MNAQASILRCPRDGGILAPAGDSGVASRCPACGGVFAVSGEMLLAIRNASMSGAINPGIRPIPPVCPSCRGVMEDRLLSGLDIDLCEACQGVWLDHGELEKANAYLARDPSAYALPSDARREFWGPSEEHPMSHERLRDAIAREAAIDLGAQGVSWILGRLVRMIVTGGR